jgi:hypothetical protein
VIGWRRLGLLALDTSRAPWAATHAALPVVEPIDAESFALGSSLRDREGRARIGRSILTMSDTPRLEPLDPDPVLDLGPLGAFDDSGVTSSCLVTSGPDRFLYYTGWSRGVTVPFYLAASVAISQDGGPFERVSLAPLLERSAIDPFLTASPCVLLGHGRWRMWYVSATEWRNTSAGPRHYYHIRTRSRPMASPGIATAESRWTTPKTSTPSRVHGWCTTPTGIACGWGRAR